MGESQKRVVSITSDPGGARTVIPVLKELSRRSVVIQPVVSGPSTAIFNTELNNFLTHQVADNISIEDAARFLEQLYPDVLLSGAGAYNQVEHIFRLAAREIGVRSISVLDYWFEYEARFQRVINGAIVKSYPDIVCALDELSREGLIRAGLNPEQIVVTGGPNLEETLRWWQEIGTEKGDSFRIKYGITNPDDRIIVFFSEPYFTPPTGKPLTGPGGLFRSNGTPAFGYTAPEMLKMVIDSLLKEVNNMQMHMNLLVKPHPLEWPDALYAEIERVQTERLTAKLLLDATPKELIAISDVVIGMSSITLLETALVGKPAVSVQIGLKASRSFDPCIGNTLGYTISIFDQETLGKAMKAICQGEISSWQSEPIRRLDMMGAAARVADVMLAK